jgi:hypothetical protein
MNALSDWKTTIPGVLILGGVVAALLLGKINFSEFQTFVGGLVSGGLLAANTKKEE